MPASAYTMWRAPLPKFPFATRRRDRGSVAEPDITIVPSPPTPRYRHYPDYPPTPVSSRYPRYPMHRDMREWDEWEEDYDAQYEVPTPPRNVERREHPVMRRAAPPSLPLEADEHDARSSRRSSSHGSDKVDFEKACTKLKKLLQTAIKQFQKLNKEFMNETKGIEKYASKRILDDLWKRKIGASQDVEDEEDLGDIDQEMQTHANRAMFLERKVGLCLQRLIDAGIDDRKDDTERESDIVVQSKIQTAGRCIQSIWPKINSSRRQCERLLTELTQVYEVLRAAYPEGEKAPEDNGNNQTWG